MSFIKKIVAFGFLGLASACASFPGGGNAPVGQNVEDVEAAKEQLASLEAEVARLKSQNARLTTDLLALKRERDSIALNEAADPAPGLETDLPAKPQYYVDDPSPKPNAVVDDAASRSLAKTDVPVETSPRLVQPTFASNETVFENEAEGGDIRTESVLFGVHLASYRHLAEARTGWRQLQRENPEELGLLEPRVESVMIEGKGDFLRLIGGGFASREKAQTLCGQLKARGLFCSVAGFEGERLTLGDADG